MTRRYASAISHHPEAAVALGEALGSVVEQVGTTPDIAVVAVSGLAGSYLAEIIDAVHTLLCPDVLVGFVTDGLIPDPGAAPRSRGPHHDQRAGVAVWAGNPGRVRPVRCDPGEAVSAAADELVLGFGAGRPADAASPLGSVLLAEVGRASQSRTREPATQTKRPLSRLWLDDSGFVDGLVGFAVDANSARVVMAHGFRPIGSPLAVTAMNGDSGGNRIASLAGEKAGYVLADTIDGLSRHERALAARGLFLGTVTNDRAEDVGPDDVVMRSILGTTASAQIALADRLVGGRTIADGDGVVVGSLVQFHLSDQEFARPGVEVINAKRATAPGILVVCAGDWDSVDLRSLQELSPQGIVGLSCSEFVAGTSGTNDRFDNVTSVVLFD